VTGTAPKEIVRREQVIEDVGFRRKLRNNVIVAVIGALGLIGGPITAAEIETSTGGHGCQPKVVQTTSVNQRPGGPPVRSIVTQVTSCPSG
jgi:hypothetical protein